MVLEILINPKKATGKPWEMFFIGATYSFFGALLSFWVFRSYVSLVMVVFTAMAAVPFIHSSIISEERKVRSNSSLVKKHGKMVSVFTFLFLGFVTTFFLLYLVLPLELGSEFFTAQLETITQINQAATGSFLNNLGTLGFIVANNLKILFFCIVFSFFYGAGAIFILAWNGSVMGAAIGNTIKVGITNHAGSLLGVVSSSIIGFFAHGIPEMISFFIGGLAGGIISVAMMVDYKNKTFFNNALWDALNLMGFAVIVLLFAALIEVFISPGILR